MISEEIKKSCKLGELYKVTDEFNNDYYINEDLLRDRIIIQETAWFNNNTPSVELTIHFNYENEYFYGTLYYGGITNNLFSLGIVNTVYDLYKKSDSLEEFMQTLELVTEATIEDEKVLPSIIQKVELAISTVSEIVQK